MNKAILVLVFALGTSFGFILSGTQTSAGSQPSSWPRQFNVSNMSVTDGKIGIEIPNAIPAVPPIRANVQGMHLVRTGQALDGLSCDGCTFEDSRLTYSGGSFALKNMTFIGSTSVAFSGAAANSLVLLKLLQSMPSGTKPSPAVPNKPLEQIQTVKAALTIDLSSPYSGN
jgi:hypothetical protein